jgi:predicted anti-sigma-YlaC factor YlaD
MEHKTARNKCLAWIEGGLGAEERRVVQRHLDECGECRSYFERISLLVERPDTVLLPRLAPDPFFPSRVRAAVEERRSAHGRRSAAGWVRISLASVVLILAAAAGIYLGNGFYANARSAEGTELAEAYYEAFSPSDFTGVWEDLFVEVDANGQQKGAQ